MKRLLIFLSLTSTLFCQIPARVETNIFQESLNQDRGNGYVRDQKRAFERIVKSGEKNGLTTQEIDEIVISLEKVYGKNYEVIYKYFSYELKDKSEEKRQRTQKNKKNEEYKVKYDDSLKVVKVPQNVKEYIVNHAKNRYPDDYEERLSYTEELIEFYNFLKK
ncbi:hypothetical protein [uncultured Cetobacterium sp.]|uniref:hypothetical protein n=1 Tax=uncultured Cetobacterium sp. TaxID=527638 RepID=UPI002632F1F9|nr:hypothetical protein [uncultured Cetobacterium sp.]